MELTTQEALKIMQQVLDGAVAAGCFKESNSVALAHNSIQLLTAEMADLAELRGGLEADK